MCSFTPVQEEAVRTRCVTLVHTPMGKNTALAVGKDFTLLMDNVRAVVLLDPSPIQILIYASLALPLVPTALAYTLHSASPAQIHQRLSAVANVSTPALPLHMPIMPSVYRVRSVLVQKGAGYVRIQASAISVFLITRGHQLAST
jgi:hypothetical protein